MRLYLWLMTTSRCVNRCPILLKELGFEARAFASGDEFLSSDCVNGTRCLILDVAMPGMTGLDLQRELGLRGPEDSDHLHYRA